MSRNVSLSVFLASATFNLKKCYFEFLNLKLKRLTFKTPIFWMASLLRSFHKMPSHLITIFFSNKIECFPANLGFNLAV